MHANDPPSPRAHFFRKLIWITRKHHQQCDALLGRHGIGSAQIPVLLMLHRHEEMTQRELAEHIHVTPATVSAMLKRMEKMGFITRTSREDDARISIVRLTEQGLKMVEIARNSFDQTDNIIFSGFSDEEFQLLEGFLNRMQENLYTHIDACCEENPAQCQRAKYDRKREDDI